MFGRLALALPCTLLALGACTREAPALKVDTPLARITERVYVLHGPNEEPEVHNKGFMNNPAFVITNKGVVVVDPGSSVQVGNMLLEKMAAVTKEPVVAVFNTHIHGDHWLGNDAIRRAYPQAVIYAHEGMIAAAPEQGAVWSKMMDERT